MKLLVLLILNIVITTYLKSQKEDYVWVMGYQSNNDTSEYSMRFGGTNIDFNTEPPTLSKVFRKIDFSMSSSSICDDNGELVFYFNGCSVGDLNNNNIIDNIHNNSNWIIDQFCRSGFNFPQSNVILKSLKEEDTYHQLHCSIVDDNILTQKNDTLFETIFEQDESSNNLLLIEKNKVISIGKFSSQRYSAIRHSNGINWWIVVPKNGTNEYTMLKMTEEGIKKEKDQKIGVNFNYTRGAGQAKFSPNGKLYAKFNPYEGLEIFNFNRQKGDFSNARHLPYWRNPQDVIAGGLEFSPDSRFIYVSALDTLWQFDTSYPDIFSTKTFIAVYDGFMDSFATSFFMMQLAPNNKIYMNSTSSSRYFHTIHTPNEKGQACDFRQHDFMLPTINALTMPYFPNYRLGAEVVSTKDVQTNNLTIYPNPAHDKIKISSDTEISHIKIYGVDARLKGVYNTNEISLDTYEKGVYLIEAFDKSKNKSISKFIKM